MTTSNVLTTWFTDDNNKVSTSCKLEINFEMFQLLLVRVVERRLSPKELVRDKPARDCILYQELSLAPILLDMVQRQMNLTYATLRIFF